ncbi:MAG: hypothetical protein VW840_11720, partial [Gammaproteobacteria bacterium]
FRHLSIHLLSAFYCSACLCPTGNTGLTKFELQSRNVYPATHHEALRGPTEDRVLDHIFYINNSPGFVFQIEANKDIAPALVSIASGFRRPWQ